jgi:hypothetical protein
MTARITGTPTRARRRGGDRLALLFRIRCQRWSSTRVGQTALPTRRRSSTEVPYKERGVRSYARAILTRAARLPPSNPQQRHGTFSNRRCAISLTGPCTASQLGIGWLPLTQCTRRGCCAVRAPSWARTATAGRVSLSRRRWRRQWISDAATCGASPSPPPTRQRSNTQATRACPPRSERAWHQRALTVVRGVLLARSRRRWLRRVLPLCVGLALRATPS